MMGQADLTLRLTEDVLLGQEFRFVSKRLRAKEPIIMQFADRYKALLATSIAVCKTVERPFKDFASVLRA
jgi:hypothetical protein